MIPAFRGCRVPTRIDLPPSWHSQIVEWAKKTQSVREIWLFGSRAKAQAEPNSDVDLAIVLMPGEWPFGNYIARGDAWQRELSAIVRQHVSLEAVSPHTEADKL